MPKQDKARRAARVERSERKAGRFQLRLQLQQAISSSDDDEGFDTDDGDIRGTFSRAPRPRGME